MDGLSLVLMFVGCCFGFVWLDFGLMFEFCCSVGYECRFGVWFILAFGLTVLRYFVYNDVVGMLMGVNLAVDFFV